MVFIDSSYCMENLICIEQHFARDTARTHILREGNVFSQVCLFVIVSVHMW